MTNWECKSCKGTYTDDQRNGYAHVCPDGIKNPRDENPVTFEDGQPFDQQQYFKQHKKYKIKKEGKGRKKL